MRGTFAFVLFSIFISSIALAAPHQDVPPGVKIQYDSWCQGDRVMTEDRDGQVYAAWDCSELSDSSRCVENAEKNGAWTIVTATCREGKGSYYLSLLFCESYENHEDCPPSSPGPDDVDDGDGGRTGDGSGPDDVGGDF